MSQVRDAAILNLQQVIRRKYQTVYEKECLILKMFQGGAKFEEIKWKGKKLEVPLGLMMTGTMTGHSPADTNRTGEVTLSGLQNELITYDYAILQDFFRYAWDVGDAQLAEGLAAVALLLEGQMDKIKRLLNISIWLGKDMKVISRSSHVAGSTSITIPVGVNTQWIYQGMVIEDSQGAGIVSGSPVTGAYGKISKIVKNNDGTTTVTLAAAMTNSWTDQPLYVAGFNGKGPNGFTEFWTKGNTLGDMNRTTYPQWNPQVWTAQELINYGFYDHPAEVLHDLAIEVRRINGEIPDMLFVSPEMQSRMASKYTDRLRVNVGPDGRIPKIIGFSPDFQPTKDIYGFSDWDFPKGALCMVSSKNVGVAPMNEMMPKHFEANGMRVAGSGDMEFGSGSAYQLFMGDPRAIGFSEGLEIPRS